MAIPQSLVVVPLLVALGMCLWAHYRIISRPDAPLFGLPMWAAVVTAAILFGFLFLRAFAPRWAPLRPVFLGLSVVDLIAAFGVRHWARKFLDKPVRVRIRNPETGEVQTLEVPVRQFNAGRRR